ncbi:MAG TPA: hypothetical protein ENL08_00890 [Bacteroidetes bacterium]|nr:hypothetical protein [Bacteroidota bacterium]
MKIIEPPVCLHCGGLMDKMEMPAEAGYPSSFVWVCFNDDCPYYVRGWQWMKEKYEVKSSYRYKINPVTGLASPLPVWSETAMKDRIVS